MATIMTRRIHIGRNITGVVQALAESAVHALRTLTSDATTLALSARRVLGSPTMNSELKNEWITALRSGNYTQAVGSLKTVEQGKVSHCCLGVLCEIALAKNIIESSVRGVDTHYYGDEFEFAVLPHVVRDWAGIDQVNPIIILTPELKEKIAERSSTIRNMNDIPIFSLAEFNDAGFTFNEIADLIDEHL